MTKNEAITFAKSYFTLYPLINTFYVIDNTSTSGFTVFSEDAVHIARAFAKNNGYEMITVKRSDNVSEEATPLSKPKTNIKSKFKNEENNIQ